MTSLDVPPDPDTLPSPQSCDDGDLAGYIDDASRYTGERTSPHKTMSVMLLNRAGRSQTAIAQILGMNERTVKAILARQDSIIADGRMLLKANTLGFVGDAIQASSEAAKRGKIEGISAMLDRLGVTEPPKAQNHVNLGVQVVLNGGTVPAELGPSLAKVTETSETPQEQAVIDVSPIIHVMDTVAEAPQVQPAQAVSTAPVPAKLTKPPKLTKAGTPRQQLKPRKVKDIRL